MPKPVFRSAKRVLEYILLFILTSRSAHRRQNNTNTPPDVWDEQLPQLLLGLWRHFCDHPLGSPETFFDATSGLICFKSDTRVFNAQQPFPNNTAFLVDALCDRHPTSILSAWQNGRVLELSGDFAKAIDDLKRQGIVVQRDLEQFQGIPICGKLGGYYVMGTNDSPGFLSAFVEFAGGYKRGARIADGWQLEKCLQKLAPGHLGRIANLALSPTATLGDVLFAESNSWITSALHKRVLEDFSDSAFGSIRSFKRMFSESRRTSMSARIIRHELVDDKGWELASAAFDDYVLPTSAPGRMLRCAVATNAPAAVAVLKEIKARYRWELVIDAEFVNGTLLMQSVLREPEKYNIAIVGDPAFFTSSLKSGFTRLMPVSTEGCYVAYRRGSRLRPTGRLYYVQDSASDVGKRLDYPNIRGTAIQASEIRQTLHNLLPGDAMTIWRSFVKPALEQRLISIDEHRGFRICASMIAADPLLRSDRGSVRRFASLFVQEWQRLSKHPDHAVRLLVSDISYMDAFMRASGLSFDSPLAA